MPAKTSVSGFPEWLPEEKLIEKELIGKVSQQYELYGFTPIETRAIEPKSVLLGKGETSQEVYMLQRLQAAQGSDDSDIGLHFDLTVPFSRYVSENEAQLAFPFRRYQIQKVWRGERAAAGRFREFYQADFDVIGRNNLSVNADYEMVRVMRSVTSAMPIPPINIKFNNRKVLEGYYKGLGIDNFEAVLRCVDKLDKIGPDAVMEMLRDDAGIEGNKARKCIDIAQISGSNISVIADIRGLGVESDLLEEGLTEMQYVLEGMQDDVEPGRVIADLRIARGLNYYTGTVMEGSIAGLEHVGSVCGGGRYDNLASGSSTKLPGVGASIGITRIMSQMLEHDLLRSSRKTPAAVYIALNNDETRRQSEGVAHLLRQRGVPCEVSDKAAKLGKQIQAANKKGIPFVWFTPMENGNHQVKDIRTGEQVDADPFKWMPPENDLKPQIQRNEDAFSKLVEAAKARPR